MKRAGYPEGRASVNSVWACGMTRHSQEMAGGFVRWKWRGGRKESNWRDELCSTWLLRGLPPSCFLRSPRVSSPSSWFPRGLWPTSASPPGHLPSIQPEAIIDNSRLVCLCGSWVRGLLIFLLGHQLEKFQELLLVLLRQEREIPLVPFKTQGSPESLKILLGHFFP